MSGTTPTDSTKPCRGRRITWSEFEKLTGRKKPDFKASNDNRSTANGTVTVNIAATAA